MCRVCETVIFLDKKLIPGRSVECKFIWIVVDYNNFNFLTRRVEDKENFNMTTLL